MMYHTLEDLRADGLSWLRLRSNGGIRDHEIKLSWCSVKSGNFLTGSLSVNCSSS